MVDKDRSSHRKPLTVRFEGPAVREHRMALHDVVLFAGNLQKAVDRVARVLLGQSESVQAGRKPADIAKACSLDVVGVGAGSFTLTCDLPYDRQTDLLPDLGERALICLVEGIEAIGKNGEVLPQGYDKGVLLALRESGKLLDHGVTRISYELATRKRRWRPSYTREVHDRLVARIQEPVHNRRSIEGRLLMGDFKASGLRCRVHPPLGRPVLCEFTEQQRDAVLGALTKYVRLVGEASVANGEIRSLSIEDIEVLDQEAEVSSEGEAGAASFDGSIDLAALAARQGVPLATEFDRLLGDFWPEEESADSFVAAVRGWRNEPDRGETSS